MTPNAGTGCHRGAALRHTQRPECRYECFRHLIAESLLKSTPLDGVPLQLRKVSRGDVGDVSVGQPLTWTFVEFIVEDQVLDDLVEAKSLA